MFDTHVQHINVSCDLKREQLNELGRKGPYHRFLNFPVDITIKIRPHHRYHILDKEYFSLSEAAKQECVSKSTIRRWCCGITKRLHANNNGRIHGISFTPTRQGCWRESK